jgi:hypothetical protein
MPDPPPDLERPLEGGYLIREFAQQEAVTQEDVIGLWTREAGLPEEVARRRLVEILMVATDAQGSLAGVSTAYLQYTEQLRAEMWYFRAFVASAFRKSNIAIQLVRAGSDVLRQRFVSGEDRRGLGVLFEVENPVLMRRGQSGLSRYNAAALWPAVNFMFIGENARGNHVRVRYFPGAVAPEPDQGPAKV